MPIRRSLSILAVAGALALALGCSAPADACYQELDAAGAQQRISDGDAVVLDVRTPGEFRGSGGHIEGALLVPLSDLEATLDQLEAYRDVPVIVVCRSGNRSSYASAVLCRRGFGEIYNLSDGMNGWARAGLPVAVE